MAENTKIEWAHHTFNPWIGCQKVGPGCDHCYAEAMMADRYGRVEWGPHGARSRTSPANWAKPLAWDRAAAKEGKRARVFCASLADVFDNHPSVLPEWRTDLFNLIAKTPNLNWLLLTKRPGNIADMLPGGGVEVWPNVWLGCTVVNQAEADRDIPKLLAVPAKVHFLSMEPLLGPVILDRMCDGHKFYDALRGNWWHDSEPPHIERGKPKLDWIICGGESGKDARPMHPYWARSLRDQCQAAGVAFHFKQWGEWTFPGQSPGTPASDVIRWLREDGLVADQPISAIAPGGLDGDPGEKQTIGGEEVTIFKPHSWTRCARVGKARAGRLLDGREWNEVPHG